MDKKSVAASILVGFLALVFAVVGTCFGSFVFEYTKIEITSVAVSSSDGIEVFEDEELTKKVKSLKLSEQKLGIKPATGELDGETQIPTTINSENTTEGYYSKVYVKSNANYKIVVSDIKIKSERDIKDIKKERENIFVAIEDIKNTTKSLEDDVVEIVTLEKNNQAQEFVFLFWLGSLASEELEGAEISFTLEFLTI